MTFPEKLRARRQEVGIPQFELAHRVGVALRTYTRWENGELEPKLSEFLRLAAILQVQPTEFIADLLAEDGDHEPAEVSS